jgi:membrane protease YdiL (CAAX protease family)
LRSGWRVLIFFLVVLALVVALGTVSPRVRNFDLHLLPSELMQALAAAGATLVMTRLDRRPFTSYGLAANHGARNLATGAAAGFAGLSLLIGLLTLSGVCRISGAALSGTAAVTWAFYWIVVFALVGWSEEMLSRGYPMFALAEGIGFRPAAVIVALLFGLGHLGNGGEQYIGIGNAVLAGLVFAYSVRWSGSLWWAIGAHMSWDWAESFFYGAADSGAMVRHHFLSASPAGPAWISGGTAGPEGSILCTAVLLLLGAAVRFTTPYRPAPGLDRPPRPTYEPSETPPPASSPSAFPSMYSAGSDDTN